MKFSKKFDEECRKFFRKVYVYYGVEFYRWRYLDNDTPLAYLPYEHDTDDGTLYGKVMNDGGKPYGWSSWLIYNDYVDFKVKPFIFTDRFVKEVIECTE